MGHIRPSAARHPIPVGHRAGLCRVCTVRSPLVGQRGVGNLVCGDSTCSGESVPRATGYLSVTYVRGSDTKRGAGPWLHRNWRLIVGILASLGGLALVVPTVDWSEVGQILRQISWARAAWLAAGVGAILSSTLTRAWRWRVLLYPSKLPFRCLLTAMLVGQTLNYFAPARVGDLARAVWLRDRAGTLSALAVGTIIVEKLWDLLVALSILALAPFWIEFPDWLVMPAYGLATLSLILIAFILCGLLWRARALWVVHCLSAWLPIHWRQSIEQSASALFDGLNSLRHRGGLWRALCGTIAVWILGAVAHLAVFWALGMNASPIMLFFISAVLRAGIAVSSVPGSIGVYEGIIVACLAIFGVSAEAALSYGLLMHAVDFGPPVALTMALVWVDHRLDVAGRPLVRKS